MGGWSGGGEIHMTARCSNNRIVLESLSMRQYLHHTVVSGIVLFPNTVRWFLVNLVRLKGKHCVYITPETFPSNNPYRCSVLHLKSHYWPIWNFSK